MERFRHLPEYQVLIYKPYDYTILAAHLQRHLQAYYKEYLGFRYGNTSA